MRGKYNECKDCDCYKCVTDRGMIVGYRPAGRCGGVCDTCDKGNLKSNGECGEYVEGEGDENNT